MRPNPLSVTDLNEYVRRTLAGDPMLQSIAVRGEISNFKRHTSGHLYFTLKDQASRLSCVMFRQYAQMLRFQPSDGMMVMLSGSVGLYTASGSYQFYGEAMVSDGAGVLYELFLKNKERLQKEGLFDVGRKRPLPLLPKGVGIVTSIGGAVLHDIKTVANRRFPGMPLYIRAAAVQGNGAAEDLAAGLKEIAALKQVDVIIIGRGGGSLEDLWAFNEEVLVRAIADCEKPVISAVGHETDVTLADFTADVRAATPSQAAELAVPLKGELLRQVDGLTRFLEQQVLSNLEQMRARLTALESGLVKNNPSTRLNVMGLQVMNLQNRMNAAMDNRLLTQKGKADKVIERFTQSGPMQTLKRGYVIALKDNKPISSVLNASGEMSLRFSDGLAVVQTIKTIKE